MKKGRTILELAQELERIQDSKRDLIVPVERMKSKVETVTIGGIEVEAPSISIDNGESFAPTDWAHSQISSFTDIPRKYYKRIQQENPHLLSSSINHGFQMAINKAKAAEKNSARMLRTHEGRIRGFLSNSYRRLDCVDLLQAVLPMLLESEFEVQSSELTEKKMYLKATTPRLEAEVKKGQIVQYGLAISSSDVGAGSVQVQPMSYELICTNGMIHESAIRKYHVGRTIGGDSVEEILRTETVEADDKAFWMKIQDIVKNSMERDVFEAQVNKLREAADVPIKNFDIPQVVELAMKQTGISGEGTKKKISEYLMTNEAEGRGMNKWGLANSFTAAARSDDINYDDATELERAGAQIIELPRKTWEAIAC